ncbi:CehA/McbA family metallohydrolase [Bacillus gobiensis]|uniref:CehA/McbA family metallohydrolase n=1 Tax=Bacillus gobiensis TaxID=1441095 RepID=UPI003D235BEE
MQQTSTRILFETTSEISSNSSQSHLKHTFFVPKETTNLTVQFHFEPAQLDDNELGQKIIEESFHYYELETENAAKRTLHDFPIKNLLTLSIDDPDGFRGAHHCHKPTQRMTVSETNSSPGILNKQNSPGLWSVTVSTHAVVTEKCRFTLSVTADGPENDICRSLTIPWQHRPLMKNILENEARGTILPRKQNTHCRWVPAELHTHTYHSDGQQSVREMAEAAKQMGLEVVAITDHNTTRPLQEIEKASREFGIKMLFGLEWTTFYGHLLTIGYDKLTYTDWRTIGPLDIAKGIDQIHSCGAIAGIAHPFRLGNPIGTGCHWEFPFESINDFDFIEVWNSTRPGSRYYNQKAFQYWTELLNHGYIITATAGRDWHKNSEEKVFPAITHVHVPADTKKETDDFQAEFLKSIKDGAISISYGPPVILEASIGSDTFSIGDIIKSENNKVSFHARTDGWEEVTHINQRTFRFRLVSNVGTLIEETGGIHELFYEMDSYELSWVRTELYAEIDDEVELIAFTNAIYFIQ